MSPQPNAGGGSGTPPGAPANRERTPSNGARPASPMSSSTRDQVTESVNGPDHTGKVRPQADQGDDRVVIVSSDNEAMVRPGDGESGNATMRIRASATPDNSWSPAPDGGGRPVPQPPSLPQSAPGSAPRPGVPGPGAPGPGRGAGSGPGGAPGPGGLPSPPSGPPGPGGTGRKSGFGAVSALASPEPIAGRSEQRAKPTSAKAPRKAHLVLRRVEPWSAMKFSFVVSLVCFVVLFVAVAVLYGVLSALGVFDSIVNTVTQITVPDGKTSSGTDIRSWFAPVRILGYTALLGAVNVVLITALSTLGAVIYNLASDLVGGVEVTFSEAE